MRAAPRDLRRGAGGRAGCGRIARRGRSSEEQHRLAVQAEQQVQSLSDEQGDDHRQLQRRNAPGNGPGAAQDPQTVDRLLLRLPDGLRTGRPERRPDDRTAGETDRDRPGLALLAGLPRLRADVPAAHVESDQHARGRHASESADGLRRRRRGVRRIPAQVQQRPSVRPDRPLAGLRDAGGADPAADRQRAGGARKDDRGDPARRSGARARRPARGCDLQTRAAVHRRDRHAVRDRVLVVPQRTARKLVLRTRRTARSSAGRCPPAWKWRA